MKAFLKTLEILPEKELQLLDPLLTKRVVKKNDYLIREGQICREIVFVQSGILRSFYVNEKGEEITNCITFENDLMSAYSSFITQNPTEENIQAISDAKLLILKREDLFQLYQSSQKWTAVGRALAEMQYVDLEKRIVSFQKQNAKQRYQELLSHHPKYIQLIPLQYLASFLGISSRHLSRLRKEVQL